MPAARAYLQISLGKTRSAPTSMHELMTTHVAVACLLCGRCMTQASGGATGALKVHVSPVLSSINFLLLPNLSSCTARDELVGDAKF